MPFKKNIKKLSLMSSKIFKVNHIDHGNVGTPKENSFKENRIFSVKSMAAATCFQLVRVL